MGHRNIGRLIGKFQDSLEHLDSTSPLLLDAGITTLAGSTTTLAGSVVHATTIQLGAGRCKVGTTAGWVVNAANNTGTIATVAASQTSSTLVMPIDGLQIGGTITGYKVAASINSAGGAVTLDCALRTLTIAAGATATDAAVASGSITQIAVSAATAATATVTGLATVVTSGVSYYLLLTATTAASTTIELDQLEITFTSI